MLDTTINRFETGELVFGEGADQVRGAYCGDPRGLFVFVVGDERIEVNEKEFKHAWDWFAYQRDLAKMQEKYSNEENNPPPHPGMLCDYSPVDPEVGFVNKPEPASPGPALDKADLLKTLGHWAEDETTPEEERKGYRLVISLIKCGTYDQPPDPDLISKNAVLNLLGHFRGYYEAERDENLREFRAYEASEGARLAIDKMYKRIDSGNYYGDDQ